MYITTWTYGTSTSEVKSCFFLSWLTLFSKKHIFLEKWKSHWPVSLSLFLLFAFFSVEVSCGPIKHDKEQTPPFVLNGMNLSRRKRRNYSWKHDKEQTPPFVLNGMNLSRRKRRNYSWVEVLNNTVFIIKQRRNIRERNIKEFRNGKKVWYAANFYHLKFVSPFIQHVWKLTTLIETVAENWLVYFT